MLDDKGFDIWADEYDESVKLSDIANAYPFAGYSLVLRKIYSEIIKKQYSRVLDIGFGTGTLTKQLYSTGCTIYGQDFSKKMVRLAKEKMPDAELYHGDFSEELVPQLKQKKYDTIVATYSLHHLDDGKKILLIRELLSLLNAGGRIYIGDIAFSTRKAMELCRESVGDEWDEDEFYFVFDELKERFPFSTFVPCSECSGVIELWG